MTYKYVCLGLLNQEKAGKVTGWFHNSRANCNIKKENEKIIGKEEKQNIGET